MGTNSLFPDILYSIDVYCYVLCSVQFDFVVRYYHSLIQPLMVILRGRERYYSIQGPFIDNGLTCVNDRWSIIDDDSLDYSLDEPMASSYDEIAFDLGDSVLYMMCIYLVLGCECDPRIALNLITDPIVDPV